MDRDYQTYHNHEFKRFRKKRLHDGYEITYQCKCGKKWTHIKRVMV